MKKLGKNAGVTMAELLIVVAIIAALGGVATIAVWNYQRSLGQLERDGIAKEIFVAAQNHLTTAYGEGYLGLAESGYGTEETEEIETGVSKGTGVFYYIVNGGSASASVFDQMLPFGAIDETVRAGGSYIIRYQPDAAKVLDVFYCTKHGSPDQFNHDLKSSEYEEVLGLKDTADENHKSDRRNWNTHILGWYGGEEAAGTSKLEAPLVGPTIEVFNEERLYVIVTDNNEKNSGEYSLKLIIKGDTSGAQKGFVLLKSKKSSETIEPANGRVYSTSSSFDVTLDDIQKSGVHFAEIESENGITFIPGENITVQAVVYSTEKLANVAYSNKVTRNSLFADGSQNNTAYIDNIRHLENLDKNISSFIGASENDTVNAVQRKDLNWSKDYSGYWEKGSITPIKKSATVSGYYYPIEPDYTLEYDGNNHSISNIKVTERDNAGLFGSVSKVSAINNLELIDFSITGTTSAGALAGSLTNCTVTNVLARNSAGASTNSITAPTAGGLIGILAIDEGTSSVNYSAAAEIVNGTVNAGGLIGNASGTINGCYSGGHTKNGSYVEWVKNNAHPYDVTGGTVGGLVGTSSATISNSYSTCSVSGTTAGGFAGTASASITKCYATGLVETGDITGTNNPNTDKIGAFAGTMSGTATSCYYYQVINEVKRSETVNGSTEKVFDHYLGVVGDKAKYGITVLDLNVDTYNAFVGSYDDWNSARVFDSALVQYYSGKYPLKSVFRSDWTANYVNATNKTTLSPPSPTTSGLITNSTEVSGKIKFSDLFVRTHYGDWPSPEVFFINN